MCHFWWWLGSDILAGWFLPVTLFQVSTVKGSLKWIHQTRFILSPDRIEHSSTTSRYEVVMDRPLLFLFFPEWRIKPRSLKRKASVWLSEPLLVLFLFLFFLFYRKQQYTLYNLDRCLILHSCNKHESDSANKRPECMRTLVINHVTGCTMWNIVSKLKTPSLCWSELCISHNRLFLFRMEAN